MQEDSQSFWRIDEQYTTGTVAAAALRCVLGALGAAVLAGVLCWRFGASWESIGQWALFAGGVTLGLLLLATMAIDKIVDAMDYRAMIRDMEALEAQIEDRDEQIDLLEQRCAALQRDLHAAETFGAYRAARPGVVVEDRNGEAMPAPAPAPIRNDAKRLIQLHFETGVWPAKDASCQKLAWTTTRWAEARDELQRHRIVTTQGKKTIVLVSSLAEALSILAGDSSSR